MPEWLKKERKVKQPGVYVRTMLKENLPHDDIYELDKADKDFLAKVNSNPEKREIFTPLSEKQFELIITELEEGAAAKVDNQWKINLTQAKVICEKKRLNMYGNTLEKIYEVLRQS
jgi:hypothetical protein